MKKMLIKVIALAISAVVVLSFSGCGGMKPATVPEDNKAVISKLESKSGLDGICKTMLEKEYIEDNCVITNAELIGAIKGYRLTGKAVNGSKFDIEIYQYDATKSNDRSKAVIASVKENKSFELFGKVVPYCYMSANDEFLLIYPDAKSVSDKADDEPNKKRLGEVKDILNKAETTK